MALYDYKCPGCEYRDTVNHPIYIDYPIVCPVCADVMAKVYSSPAAVFPGGGWGKDAR